MHPKIPLKDQKDPKKKLSYAYNDIGLQNLTNSRAIEPIPFSMDAVGEGLGVKDEIANFTAKEFTIRKNKLNLL